MGYSPQNVAVYMQAIAGSVAGLRAVGNFVDISAGDYISNAQAADAFAQAVDTQWQAIVSSAPTNFEMGALMVTCFAAWTGRSPLTTALGSNPGNYLSAAQSIIAQVIEANAQIVNEGVNPNAALYTGGGGGGGITQLTGDVTAGPGSGSQAATVAKVNGATVPAAGGGLTTGNVPQVTGASALGYAPINLGGGANFVTGTLPAGNQASQAMGGDVGGTTAASVVNKVNGTSVPAGGSLTTGNVLTATGPSTAAWQAPAGGGGLTAPVSATFVTKTGNYTLDSGGSDFGVFADTSGGAWTLTLPAPSANRGFYIIDKKGSFGAGNLSLAQHSTEKINGLAATKVLQANWAHYWVWSDGTDWYVS